MTAGGIIASISRVIDDDEIEAEIAPNVKVRVLRSTITTILSKPEPAKGGKSSTPKDVPTQLIEGEINEIDATADANMTADGSKKRRPLTKAAAAKAAAAEAKATEIKTAEITTTETTATDDSVKTDTTN